MNWQFFALQSYELYEKGESAWTKNKENSEKALALASASTPLKISGILRLKDGVTSGSITGTIAYNRAFTEKMIREQEKSELISAQKKAPAVNVLTGKPFATGSTTETYETNLKKFGAVQEDSPSAIYIYPTTFENKDYVVGLIDAYNADKKTEEKISYTDYIGLLLSSVTIIVNVVSYVLIAFVSISLIVSSIMIGIITYISVLERTKEIGVLRSIGASKRNISQVFNAETIIVGFFAGVLGIAITLLLNIPINIIINHFASIGTVASLPWAGGVILVVISTLLTFIAGLIPSGIAAKKDPVIALRSE